MIRHRRLVALLICTFVLLNSGCLSQTKWDHKKRGGNEIQDVDEKTKSGMSSNSLPISVSVTDPPIDDEDQIEEKYERYATLFEETRDSISDDKYNSNLLNMQEQVITEGFYYISAYQDEPVFSLCKGVVLYADWADYHFGDGIVVKIEDSLGNLWLYEHLNGASVEAGDIVEFGEVIGDAGSTGNIVGINIVVRIVSAWDAVSTTQLNLEEVIKLLEENGWIRIKVKKGDYILALCNGVIVSNKWDGPYGNTVTIQDSDGHEWRYEHLQSVSVNIGDEIKVGEVLGRAGKTGIIADVCLSVKYR